MKEIGSEYHFTKIENGNGIKLPKVKDFTFTFSGRTAIETVLNNEPQIKSILLPSYCCDSMIEPFRKKAIQVNFYSVNCMDKLVVEEIHQEADAILWCNYFGFVHKMPEFSSFISNGGIVIEDITHSFYSQKQYHEQSHYIVASLRKWGPLISGGYCGCRDKFLSIKPKNYPSSEYIFIKEKAMNQKSAYLNGFKIYKEDYLQKFNYSNKWLAEHYSDLMIDECSMNYLKSLDFEKEQTIRKTNAQILYEGLRECKNISFLFDESEMDCPLFVPIIMENGVRNKLRERLIEQEIYCPIHWPKPKMNCESNLYDMELSLICDQRYNGQDMKRIISVIKELY